MQRTFMFSGIVSMLLAGFAWADEPQADVLFYRTAPAPQVYVFGFSTQGGASQAMATQPILQAYGIGPENNLMIQRLPPMPVGVPLSPQGIQRQIVRFVAEENANEQPVPPPAAGAVQVDPNSNRFFFQMDQDGSKTRDELLFPPNNFLINDTQIRAPGEYWLGVGCYPMIPLLRMHLNLSENQGLIVNNVVPEGPAAKAGIEENDILMAAGEKKLASMNDLIDAVNSAKDTAITFEIIHAGKSKTLEITPAKRPAVATSKREANAGDWNEFEQWMQKMRADAGAAPPARWQFRVIQPGAILPPNAPLSPSLPGNMSVIIDRSGDKPAKIKVEWNGKKWEVTEKELDKLPAEVRPHVDRMLGHTKIGAGGTGAHAEAMNSGSGTFFTAPAPPPGAPGMQMQIQPFKSIEQRLDEMNRKIDELQKQLQGKQSGKIVPAQAEQGNDKGHIEQQSPQSEHEPAEEAEK